MVRCRTRGEIRGQGCCFHMCTCPAALASTGVSLFLSSSSGGRDDARHLLRCVRTGRVSACGFASDALWSCPFHTCSPSEAEQTDGRRTERLDTHVSQRMRWCQGQGSVSCQPACISMPVVLHCLFPACCIWEHRMYVARYFAGGGSTLASPCASFPHREHGLLLRKRTMCSPLLTDV